MDIFDLDKNSLPEQVQINKADIKDIKENLMPADLQAAKDYADAQDVINLQTAKDYADYQDAINLQTAKDYAKNRDYYVFAALLRKEGIASVYDSTATYNVGDLVVENVMPAEYDPQYFLWRCNTAITTPEPFTIAHWTAVNLKTLLDEKRNTADDIAASDITSGTATSGQVLTADGNGEASWQTPSASGGLTLKWSGQLQMSSNSTCPITLDVDKFYIMSFSTQAGDVARYNVIVKHKEVEYYFSFWAGVKIYVTRGYFVPPYNAMEKGSVYQLNTSGNTTNVTGTSDIYLREINELS